MRPPSTTGMTGTPIERATFRTSSPIVETPSLSSTTAASPSAPTRATESRSASPMAVPFASAFSGASNGVSESVSPKVKKWT